MTFDSLASNADIKYLTGVTNGVLVSSRKLPLINILFTLNLDSLRYPNYKHCIKHATILLPLIKINPIIIKVG
jgi:hypothetical protein